MGFAAAGSVIRLYYTSASTQSDQQLYHDFPVTTGATQYYQLGTDFGTSAFSGLVRGGAPLVSTASADMALAQAGVGSMIRLDFPHLAQLSGTVNPMLLNAAILEVYPVPGSAQSLYTPPTSVAMYETDGNNVPLNLLTTGVADGEYQQATLQQDDSYGLNSKYQFNLTSYFMNRLGSGDSQMALLLAAIPSAYIQTVNRLVVGGTEHPTHRVKLKLYFTKIQ